MAKRKPYLCFIASAFCVVLLACTDLCCGPLGLRELVLPLVKCEDDAILTEGASSATSEVTIMTAAEDAVVAQYSQSTLSEDEFSPEAFSVYAPFGLSCDSVGEALYYRGRAAAARLR